jgi:multisubunit Na+/H+ antiporter MnhG subunit
MIDLFIFYVVFSYLYVIGVSIAHYDGKNSSAEITGIVFALLFAPVTMTVLMGIKR